MRHETALLTLPSEDASALVFCLINAIIHRNSFSKIFMTIIPCASQKNDAINFTADGMFLALFGAHLPKKTHCIDKHLVSGV